MGQEHLVVPSPFTRQICEQPPLSWAQGCCPEKEKKEERKGREGGKEEGKKGQLSQNQLFMNCQEKPNVKLPWTFIPLTI